MSVVPVIDIADLFESGAPRLRVARAIGAACEQIGFFCIAGHGVDAGLTDEVRRVARSFFRLPLAQKQAISRQPPRFRGYVGMGTEGLGRISGYGVADLKEAFSMGPVDFPGDPYHTSAEGAAHFETNRWPAHPADFRPVMEAYYRVMAGLAARLMGGFALAHDLPEDWFADKIDHPISNVRVNFYPPQAHSPEVGMIRAGAHTDYGSVTILLTEAASAGLEVRSVANQWFDIPHRPQLDPRRGPAAAKHPGGEAAFRLLHREGLARIAAPVGEEIDKRRAGREQVAYLLARHLDGLR